MNFSTMVEKYGVEISSHYQLKGHFNPEPFDFRLFNPELFNPMAQKVKVEMFLIEKSEVE